MHRIESPPALSELPKHHGRITMSSVDILGDQFIRSEMMAAETTLNVLQDEVNDILLAESKEDVKNAKFLAKHSNRYNFKSMIDSGDQKRRIELAAKLGPVLNKRAGVKTQMASLQLKNKLVMVGRHFNRKNPEAVFAVTGKMADVTELDPPCPVREEVENDDKELRTCTFDTLDYDVVKWIDISSALEFLRDDPSDVSVIF
jgi:hypothetical protein